MDWRDRIHSEPKILSGKPVVRGTRLPVKFLLRLFASGWTEDRVLDNYPNLKRDDLLAVFAYAAEAAREERSLTLRQR